MPIQYSGESNKILLNGAGAIANECCCDPYINTCNGCDPKLKDRYVVTIAGVEGECSDHDGAYTVTWLMGCTWVYDFGGDNQVMLTNSGDNSWLVATVWACPHGCAIQWRNDDGEECRPGPSGMFPFLSQSDCYGADQTESTCSVS